MTQKINLVFMGTFTYPHGMAGTKRIQNVINALKEYPDISRRVILQRQSSEDNILAGVYEGTSYETVMGDLMRGRMIAALPILYYRTISALKRACLYDHKNILYFYGFMSFDSLMPLMYARKLGYKIVFDVIEDFGLAREISKSLHHRLLVNFTNRFLKKILKRSAGVIVISKYLEEKSRILTHGKLPIHYMPVSVNMDQFTEKPRALSTTVSLFYAGSFGKKDGLPVLLDAFDMLAGKYKNVCLVLTGRGDSTAMKEFFTRLEMSPHKDRIEYKGYLDDKDYYALLNDADIPCMTRMDLAFAQAGFPFKLGEFLASGKPVIASRVSDIDKFLVNGQNAMLVKPGSRTEICTAAEFLMNNPESALSIGMRGREVAKSFFDYRQQGRTLRIFLETV